MKIWAYFVESEASDWNLSSWNLQNTLSLIDSHDEFQLFFIFPTIRHIRNYTHASLYIRRQAFDLPLYWITCVCFCSTRWMCIWVSIRHIRDLKNYVFGFERTNKIYLVLFGSLHWTVSSFIWSRYYTLTGSALHTHL